MNKIIIVSNDVVFLGNLYMQLLSDIKEDDSLWCLKDFVDVDPSEENYISLNELEKYIRNGDKSYKIQIIYANNLKNEDEDEFLIKRTIAMSKSLDAYSLVFLNSWSIYFENETSTMSRKRDKLIRHHFQDSRVRLALINCIDETFSAQDIDSEISNAIYSIIDREDWSGIHSWLILGSLLPKKIPNVIEPNSIDELQSIYNRYNFNKIHIVGSDLARAYFHQKFPEHIVVSMRKFNAINLELNKKMINVQAGATFRTVNRLLIQEGLGLYATPNYGQISIGTAASIPIHAANTKLGVIAHTIEKVSYYDPQSETIQSVNKGNPLFSKILLNARSPYAIVDVAFPIRERFFYTQEKEIVLIDTMSASEIIKKFESAESATLRVHLPKYFKTAIFSYFHGYPFSQLKADNKFMKEKAGDSIDMFWDRIDTNEFTRFIFKSLQHFICNIEVFMNHDDFVLFWNDFLLNRRKYPYFKLEIRYCCKDDLNFSPFYKTCHMAVDFIILKSKKNIDFARRYLSQFRDLKFHEGKFLFDRY